MNLSKFAVCGLAAAVALAFSSCSNNDGTGSKITTTYTFEGPYNSFDFTEEGYLKDTYSNELNGIYVNSVMYGAPTIFLSHTAGADVWDGISYPWWKGFTISCSTDKADHSNGDWTKYQWGSIVGKGPGGVSNYALACWDVRELLNGIVEKPACSIAPYGGGVFQPKGVYITNSAYGYYVMLRGNAFCPAFTSSDWCKVHIKGVLNNNVVKTIDLDLFADGKPLDEWKFVDLSSLGEVNYIYFQMSSSSESAYGMNNPAYFCLGNFVAYYEY